MKHQEKQFSENLLSTTTSRHETQSSSSVREYSVPQIPDDLLIEIFSRVPGKSIARFRCVSKFLVSILDQVTELLLTKSLTRPQLLFTVKSKGKLLFYSSPQPHNPDDDSSIVISPYRTSFPEYFPCDICTTVCGLVLLQGYTTRKGQVICNPATGQFLTLPKVLLKEKNLPKVKAKSNRDHIARMYLGYDPIGKQFKVLCMTSSYERRPNTHQVLTLESGKRVWRTIEHRFHFEDNYRIRGEICINGVLYFGTQFVRSYGIVCFDVRSEKLSFVNIDKDMELGYPSLTLFNYKGKLGIRYRDLNSLVDEKELVLRVLEDAGNHKWSKRSYALLSPSCSKLVRYKWFAGMTSTGGVVLAPDYSERSNPPYAFFYNLESKTFKRVSIQGLEEFTYPHINRNPDMFLNYVEIMKFM